MKNSFWIGGLVGTAAPILAYVLSNFTKIQGDFFTDKPIALYVMAAFINLVIVRFTYRSGKESFAKGMIFITFVAMLVLVIVTRLKV